MPSLTKPRAAAIWVGIFFMSVIFTACPEATDMPATLKLTDDAVWLFPGEQGSINYAATASGGGKTAVTVDVEDPDIIEVKDYLNGVIALKGLRAGGTVITVTNNSDASLSETICVTVSNFFPEAGKIDAHIDGELVIAFDNEPLLATGGSIRIHDRVSGSLVDEIRFEDETQTTLGTSNNVINVGSQLARVDGNRVYITPHFGKLRYDGEYYVVIPPGAITAELNGSAFNGIDDGETWWFAIRAAPVLNEPVPITVDRAWNSRTDFRSVYGAMSAVADRGGDWIINVTPGIYTELVRYVGRSNITVNGTGGEPFGRDVVIQWTNNQQLDGGASGATHRRASFY